MKAVITGDLRLEGGPLIRNAEFSASRTTGASRRARAARIGRRRKARWSVPSATCAAISSTAALFCMMRISITSGSSGEMAWRMCACMAPRASARASASTARSGSCCGPSRRDATRLITNRSSHVWSGGVTANHHVTGLFRAPHQVMPRCRHDTTSIPDRAVPHYRVTVAREQCRRAAVRVDD